MRTRTTKHLALSVALVAGLSAGCFGNCGGCVGGALDDSFEALGEAVEKGAQAEMDKDLRAEAERELAVAEGRKPRDSGASELGSHLTRADLTGLGAAELKERMGAAGYELIGCDELDTPSRDQSQVDCTFGKKDRRAKLSLHRFERASGADELATELLMMNQLAVRDGDRLLAVQVADPKQTRALIAKLAVEAIPAARAMRSKLEGLGLRVLGCEREEEQGEIDMTCVFSRGASSGMAIWIRSPEDEAGLESGLEDGRPEWTDDLMLSQVRGRVVTSLTITDRAAARALAKKLLPGLSPKADRLVVFVSMDDGKPNGKGWDALGGAPDPYIVVDGTSLRDERCEDDYECAFLVPKADVLEIKVVDADGAADNPAGKATCRLGRPCETRSAVIELREIW